MKKKYRIIFLSVFSATIIFSSLDKAIAIDPQLKGKYHSDIKVLEIDKGNVDKITNFFAHHESMAPYLFTFEAEDPNAKVHTRLFAPHFGVLEDPATGSAAGPLAGYLLKHNVFGSKFEIQNEQGIEMGRPSQIMMRGCINNGNSEIEIGGKCCFIGHSTFNI